MALNATGKQEVIVSAGVHPHYRAVLQGRLADLPAEVSAQIAATSGVNRSAPYRRTFGGRMPTMVEARRLYEQFGFSDIEPYRPNPIVGTRYLGKKL